MLLEASELPVDKQDSGSGHLLPILKLDPLTGDMLPTNKRPVGSIATIHTEANRS